MKQKRDCTFYNCRYPYCVCDIHPTIKHSRKFKIPTWLLILIWVFSIPVLVGFIFYYLKINTLVSFILYCLLGTIAGIQIGRRL